MDMIAFAALIGAIALNSVLPGPIVFLIFARAVEAGVSAGTRIVLGVVVADLISLTVSWSILTYALALSEHIYQIMKVVGAIILISMAIQMFRGSSISPESKANQTTLGMPDIVAGFILGLTCPYTIAFMIAILPQLVPVAGMTASGGLMVAITMTAATAVPLCGIALAAAGARQVSATAGRWVMRAGGTSLVIFAVIGVIRPI